VFSFDLIPVECSQKTPSRKNPFATECLDDETSPVKMTRGEMERLNGIANDNALTPASKPYVNALDLANCTTNQRRAIRKKYVPKREPYQLRSTFKKREESPTAVKKPVK
jgi:hypothetical protein